MSVQLRLSLKEEDVDLLEELFVQEGIIFDPDIAVPDIDLAFQDVASRQITSLVQAVEELTETVQEVCVAPIKSASSCCSCYPAHQGAVTLECASMVQLTDENEKLRHQLEVAQEIAARAQCAAADRSRGALFGFVPAAVLRSFGFVPD